MGSNGNNTQECGPSRNVRHFLNRHVKVGNWAEDLLTDEVNQTRMWYYLLRHDTMTQKVNDVYRDFFRSIELPSDSHNIMFGQLIQLRCPCIRAFDGEKGLTLAITLSEDDVELGETVKCGNVFMLKSAAKNGLLVEAEPPRFGTPQHPYNNAVVRLTDRPSKDCWWVAEYKRIRGETPKENQPVRVLEEMVLRKATNGESLAVETALIYSTFFGKEYSVTACNPKGRTDLMMPEILWEFVTGIR